MKNPKHKVCLYFTCAVLLTSCSGQSCKDTNQYNLAIEYYNTLESTYKGQGALIGDALIANLVLVSITGIRSKASYGDITVYSSHGDFSSDLKKWKNWIIKESCKHDLKLLKEKENRILVETEWIEK